MASSDRPITAEPVHNNPIVQNGDFSPRNLVGQAGRLGDVDRSDGRLLPHPGSSVISEVSTVRVAGHSIPVPGPTVRTSHGSADLHQGHETVHQDVTCNEHQVATLYRRLVSGRQLCSDMRDAYTVRRDVDPETRLHGEPGQVTPSPVSTFHVHRHAVRPAAGHSVTITGEMAQDTRHRPTLPTPTTISQEVAESNRHAEFMQRRRWPSPLQSTTAVPAHTLVPGDTGTIHSAEYAYRRRATRSKMVAARRKRYGRRQLTTTAHGTWTDEQKLLHINMLELMAVDLALKRFTKRLRRTRTCWYRRTTRRYART